MRDTCKKVAGRREKRSKVFTLVLPPPCFPAFWQWLFLGDHSFSIVGSSADPVSAAHPSNGRGQAFTPARPWVPHLLFGSFNSERYSVNPFIDFFVVKPSVGCHLFCARPLTNAIPVKFLVEEY